MLAQAKQSDAAWAGTLDQTFAQMLHEVQKKQFAMALATMDQLSIQMKGKEYAKALTRAAPQAQQSSPQE